MNAPIDLLARPTYGMSQVDNLLGLVSGTTRRWVDGYKRGSRRYPPVIRLEHSGDELVTWGEFGEARLLAGYRTAGIALIRMRPAVERLRELFNTLYPLASAQPWLQLDGRELVMRAQDEVKLERPLRFVVVRNGQLLLAPPTQEFVDSAVFTDEGILGELHPRPDLRHVVFNPLRQFGEPVVRSVPTAVIAEQTRAGDHPATIAELYDLTQEEVWEAIRYELIRGRDTQQAA